MRAYMRCQLSHGLYNACNYCYQPGFRTPIERARIPGQSQAQHQADAATDGSRIAFPWQPPGKYRLRTQDDVKAVQEAIYREELAVGSPEALGYKSKSPLLEINGFDIILVYVNNGSKTGAESYFVVHCIVLGYACGVHARR
jgi:hypothetical protein